MTTALQAAALKILVSHGIPHIEALALLITSQGYPPLVFIVG
jgi:hypothetical protein